MDIIPKLPSALYDSAASRRLDKLAMEQYQQTDLMERAGLSAFEWLKRIWPEAIHITVWCGPGNNGGDGYVLARLAHQAACQVTVYALGDPQKLQGDAATAYQKAIDAGVNVHTWTADLALVHADVIVDALLGTGFHGTVQGAFLQAIQWLNQSGAPKLALDIPSGVNADTGAVCGDAVRAALTVTFIGVKPGLLTGSGCAYCGQLVYADLAVPTEVFAQVKPSAQRLDLSKLQAKLPPRARDAHKGQFGHVVIVGGDTGMAGAVRMAGEAALRVGAGKVTVASRPEHMPIIQNGRPELMCHSITQLTTLEALLDTASVVILGPGLGQKAWGAELFHAVLHTERPLVIDADALRWLSRYPSMRDHWILTPHPGEAASLLGVKTAAIQQERFKQVKLIQQRYGGVVVLKGAGTLIQAPQACCAVCDLGNPGMATAGMGDVLTGIIGGLVAQGLGLSESAALGVCIHAKAGDDAAKMGERGLVAGDVLSNIRHNINPSLL